MNNQITIEFSRKWRMSPEQVETVYTLIEQCGGKYGKSRRILVGFGVDLSVRQLKYFYRKCRLYRKLHIEGKGKPGNYSKILRNAT